eukprot:42138-Eustigmatos_ZCMA.PRE.1
MTTYQSHNGFDQRLNVSSEQAVSVPGGYKHEYQVTPSVSSASWGSQFVIRFSQKNLDLSELTL